MYKPTIITRRKKPKSFIWEVTGRIDAEKAVYKNGKWLLTNGGFTEKGSPTGTRPIASYESDITPKDIPVRRKSRHLPLLSWSQLAALAARGTKNMPQLCAQMHFLVRPNALSHY